MSTAKQIQEKIDAHEQEIDALLNELRVAERVETEARWDNPDDTVDQHEQLIIDLGSQIDRIDFVINHILDRLAKVERNVREGRIPKAARERWEDTPIENDWYRGIFSGPGSGLA